MNRESKIIKNTIVYSIGNFGSKILAYVMVLVYTHYISTSDLGYYDIIITTVSLLQPIILMMFDDGIYRWLVDDKQKNKTLVIATCLKAILVTTAISIVALFVLNLKFHFEYVVFIALYLASCMIYQMILNTVRGLGNNRLYATSGIMNSGILLGLEVIGLIVLGLGIEALILSTIIANVITILFLYTKQAELHGLMKYKFNSPLAKDVYKYSAPLIPNNICWWVINSSDRYIILFLLGTTYNGIYSLSNKFPTVVTTVTGILYLALQETIIKEYESPDRDDFYSNIFRKYYILLFSLVICGIPATKVVIELFVSHEYITAWMYTGFLYLSTVFSALSSFLGIGYQISRETRRSLVSTVTAAAVNIGVNILLIQKIGLYAASLSTMVAYIFLMIIRINHSKKYFNLHVNWIEFFCLLGTSIVMLGVTFITSKIISCIIATMVGVIFAAFMNRDLIFPLINKLRHR